MTCRNTDLLGGMKISHDDATSYRWTVGAPSFDVEREGLDNVLTVLNDPAVAGVVSGCYVAAAPVNGKQQL